MTTRQPYTFSSNIVVSGWTPWFAWRPVTAIGGRRYWCKKIFRRSRLHRGLGIHYYEYGNVFDMIQDLNGPSRNY